MTTLHHPAPQGVTPFAIYEDPEDQDLLSPSAMYEEDMSFDPAMSPSAADEAIPSIEFGQEPQDEPEPYRSSYTSRKSGSQPRHSSGVTHYSFISAIPSESSIGSKPITQANQAIDPGYIPRKERPRFRNPESVRALQMSSPVYEAPRERAKGSYKMGTPSRSARSETPVSRRSESRRSIREHRSPKPAPTPQQAPLVLLHVTILPMHVPCPYEIMTRIMPEWLVENYKLLEEKLQDIILMRRGLLIPHPRDEYDLLEERILESLELKTPRILPCGHFMPPDDDTDMEEDDDMESVTEDATGRGSRMSGGTLTEDNKPDGHGAHIRTCADCHRALKKPGQGVGAGTRKWDIKIYAANGLMRAPAWTACWNDMERCDVEISPWIPEEIRKTLEKRANEEMEADKRKQLYTAELQRQIQEATAKQKVVEEEAKEEQRLKDIELQKSFDAAAAALQRSVEEKAAERKRFEDALEEKIEAAKETVRLELEARTLAESDAVAARLRVLEEALKEKNEPTPVSDSEEEVALTAAISQSISRRPRSGQIPLSTLLKNYCLVLLGDKRNFLILFLGAAVVFLSMNMTTTIQQATSPQLTATPHERALSQSVATVAVTTTATSFSTLTVTEIQTATSMQETALRSLVASEPEAETADTLAHVHHSILPESSPVEASNDIGSVAEITEHTEDILPVPEVQIAEVEDMSSSQIDSHPAIELSTPDLDICPLASVFASSTPHCAA
jgi:hypothetical protein